MIAAFKALPKDTSLRPHMPSDKEGIVLREQLGNKPAGLFKATELIILSRLPELDYFQPEETKWMRALRRAIKERECYVTQH